MKFNLNSRLPVILRKTQMDLFGKEDVDFNHPYYSKHLITYIGNKRSLLPFLSGGFEFVKEKLNKDKLVILDGFSGSGVVSRLLKTYSLCLHSNDIENYAYIINKCYLSNKSEIDFEYIKEIIDYLNNLKMSDLYEGFITKNYAPKDDDNIKEGERVFYTHKNAMLIDTMKRFIFTQLSENERCFVLAPLLIQASIHTNTSGVFKGFHKKDGIGHFGGKGENCLERIKGDIKLDYPMFSSAECDVYVFKTDINKLVKSEYLEYDFVYYDPPYNQHPYGSNYFMLNIIADPSECVEIQNGVSGISVNWYKSSYNRKQDATDALDDLIKNTNSKYVLLSYNNEGIIPYDAFRSILEKYGKVFVREKDYSTYKGCRNLYKRTTQVKELLWILKRG